MRVTINYPLIGKIEYRSNLFDGRVLTINGTRLKELNVERYESNYLWQRGEEEKVIKLIRSPLGGAKIVIDNETIEFVSDPKWQDWLMMAILMTVWCVWGNIKVLCSVFPILGGASGAMIYLGCGIIGVYITKRQKQIQDKIFACILFFITVTLITSFFVA